MKGTQAGRGVEHGSVWLVCCEINRHVIKPKMWQTFLWRVLDCFFWRSLPLVLPLECYCPSMRPASIAFKEQMRKSSLLVQSNHHSALNNLSWLGFGFFSVLEQGSLCGWVDGGFQEGGCQQSTACGIIPFKHASTKTFPTIILVPEGKSLWSRH